MSVILLSYFHSSVAECRRSQNDSVEVQCDGNITKVTWPTDLQLPGNTSHLPEHIKEKIELHMTDEFLLHTVVQTRRPP